MDVTKRLRRFPRGLRWMLNGLLCIQLGLLLNLPLPARAFAVEGSLDGRGFTNLEKPIDADKDQKCAGLGATGCSYPELEEYLAANVDEELAAIEEAVPLNPLLSLFGLLTPDDARAFADSCHTLYMKYTLVDAQMVGADETLDDVFEKPNWMEAFLGQYDLAVDLLDPGSDCDYLIGLADVGALKDEYRASDWAFTELSNDGVGVEGPLFDNESGIAYVPKSLYFRDGEEVPFALQQQLMIRVDGTAEPESSFDLSVTSQNPAVQTAPPTTQTASLFDVDVAFTIVEDGAERIGLEDLSVFINGSDEALELLDGTNASYDPSTGCLSLFFAPINLFEVSVAVTAPNLFDIFAPRAAALASQSLAYVPDVIFDSLDLDTLHIGDGFYFGTTCDYWWPSSVSAGTLSYDACINSGSYCYSWVSNPNSLYEYIAWVNGADWNGVANGDVGSFPGITQGSTETQRNYFNYVFWYGNIEAGGQNWHSERWSRNVVEWDSGAWGSHFGLQCSHSTKPIGNFAGQDSTMWARVLDINTEVDTPYIVLGFCGPGIANQPGVGVYKFAIEVEGRIQVNKASLLPAVTNGNAAYDLSRISYDVYADAGCTRFACSISLEASGFGESPELKKGTYYLREHSPMEPASGYALDTTIYPVTVNAGKTSTVSLSDHPQIQEADVAVNKHDAELATGAAQGNGTMAGAEFTVRYYPSRFATPEEAIASGAPLRTWVLRTDGEGIARFSSAHLVRGDALYANASGAPCLPLGTYLIQETRAPEGYLLTDSAVHVKQVSGIGSTPQAEGFDGLTVDDEVMRGGVRIEKRDGETELLTPLGAASIDGTAFAIINRSAHGVLVDGIAYEPGEIVTIIAAKNGVAKTAPDALPFGAYGFEEVSPGEGYLLSDGDEHSFTIAEDGQAIDFAGQNAIYDQVKRGDLEFVKMRSTDSKRLANVPFRLTSTTTGESHVLVTDANGCVKTSADWNAHTYKTNFNDQYAFGDGTVHEDGFDPLAGVWFGLAQEGGMVNANNALGALPYDTYRLEELRSKANAHLELINLDEIRIARDATTIDLGTIENRPVGEVWITTNARNGTDGSKFINPEERVSIIDRVEYGGLDVTQGYGLTGTLMLKRDGSVLHDAFGKPVTYNTTFTPESPNGYVELEFTFSALELFGESIVCFEELTEAESGQLVAEHRDLDDYDQTIEILTPQIGTFATDLLDGDKVVGKAAASKIVDRVSYKNVAIGRAYIFNGALMEKAMDENGDAQAQPLKDAKGDPVTSQVVFVPDSPTGIVDVEFEFDSSSLEDGAELVVFETLSSGAYEYVVHTDVDNAAQTMRIGASEISTCARDGQDGDKEVSPTAGASVIDTITYDGLIPGEAYSVFGHLMVASTGTGDETEAAPLLDDDGNEVIASCSFTPEEESGVVEVAFRFDASALNGTKLVAFEDLYQADALIASHSDPDDEAQTVHVNGDGPAPPISPKGLPSTGDSSTIPYVLAAFALLGGIVAVIAMATQRRRG